MFGTRTLGIGPWDNGYPIGGVGANPHASCAADAGGLIAGAAGVILDRFGWVDPISGEVSNIYTAGFTLGYVLPQPQRLARNGWLAAYWNGGPPAWVQNPGLVLRAGQMVTMLAVGDFWIRFPGGVQAGQQRQAHAAAEE